MYKRLFLPASSFPRISLLRGSLHLAQETLPSQVVAGSALPPGGGGLRARRHPAAPRLLHPTLQARQQVLARRDRLLAPRHRQYRQLTDHRPQRCSRHAQRRRRRGRGANAYGQPPVRRLRHVYDMVRQTLFISYYFFKKNTSISILFWCVCVYVIAKLEAVVGG